MYYLLDLERTIKSDIAHYWKPNRHGYTINLDDAGLYTKEEALTIVKGDYDQRTVMIAKETVERIKK